MKPQFRLIVYLVVTFVIPLLIWLVYHEFPVDAWLWIGFCLLLLGGYELIIAIRKRKGK